MGINNNNVENNGELHRHTNSVGVKNTYEETFMDQVNNLGPSRIRKLPPRLRDNESTNIHEECLLADSPNTDIDEPRTMKQAINSPNSGTVSGEKP